MTSPPFKEDDNKDIISLLKGRMLNKFCRDFGIYEDICRNMIGLSKDGSLTVASIFPLTKSLKTLIISMLLSFFIVKYAKINVGLCRNM